MFNSTLNTKMTTANNKISYVEQSRVILYFNDIRFGPYSLSAYGRSYVDMTSNLISVMSQRVGSLTTSNYSTHIYAITLFCNNNDKVIPYAYSGTDGRICMHTISFLVHNLEYT